MDKSVPPLKSNGPQKPVKSVKIKEYSIPKQSASPTRLLSASPNNRATTADSKRTIWDLDSDQLDGGQLHPNYMTPNASRRLNRSGLVKPQWSTPPVTAGFSSPATKTAADRGDIAGISNQTSPKGTTSFTETVSPMTASSEPSRRKKSVESERNSFYDAKDYDYNTDGCKTNDKSTQTKSSGNCIIL